MNCPKCAAAMESGTLDLKAWGVGVAPQAQRHFNDELLAKDQYVPVLGFVRQGTTMSAHRCPSCRLVTFEYRPVG